MWEKVWTQQEIDRLQFRGKYQVAELSPCLSCLTSSVDPASYVDVGELLGTGSFGKVFKVAELKTGKFFAMKIIEKQKYLSTREIERLVEERRILASLCHPFIVRYETHFQTKSSVFLLMEYVSGGDLFKLLMSRKRFNQDSTRFYLSEVLLSLEYLHSLGIVYRDLKLENILIDAEGHVKLTDFGLSHVVGVAESGRCWSLVGTVDYLAPEVLAGRQYSRAVDWWSFGVLGYELRSGKSPFHMDKENDCEGLLTKIKSSPPQFLSDLDLVFVDLIKELLKVDPHSRLGTTKRVRGHAWFQKVDFESVYARAGNVKPPYVPATDTERSSSVPRQLQFQLEVDLAFENF